jgi:tetratricopeptide (TPR) repeat protein
VSTATRLLTVVVVALLLPIDADARWTRLRTANFQFIGDAPAGQIREVAEKLEQFREVMVRALPGATTVTPVPTIVVVFSSDRALTPVKPLFRGNTTDVSGYFQAGEDLNYIALNGEYIDIALLTIFHEYAHVLVTNTLGRAPVWLSEGLAEFYDVMQGLEGGKTVVIGRAPAQHVELLKSSTLMPIKQLLAIDHDSPVYNEGSRRGVFYAESWALTHYLTLGNRERTPQLSKYLAAVKSGADPAGAFTDAFGPDLAVLDRELFQYVRQVAFPALRLQFNQKITGEAERGTTMDDIEADVYVADLQARIGREQEGRARLQAVLARKPDIARASTALGLIDFRARRFKEALPALERAAGQAPQDAFVQTAFGRGLVAIVNETPEIEAKRPALQKARDALSRAVEIDATSAYAAGVLGYILLAEGKDIPRAVAMLERASQLAPSREQYRLLLAQALIEQGELKRATNYLGPLLSAGSSADVRNDARRLLGEVGNRSSQGTAGSGRQPAGDDALLSLSAAADVALPSPVAPPRTLVTLDLRPVKEGETRVLGMFRGIECPRAGGVVLNVDANGKPFRLEAKQLSDIEFITYRSDQGGSVTCGALPMPQRVFATYRARAGAAAGAGDMDAVAIELLPDEYVPPR